MQASTGLTQTQWSERKWSWFASIPMSTFQVIYQPPGLMSRFFDDFSAWLPYFLSSVIPTIILGDFNIPNNVNSTTTSQLFNLTSSLDLTQWTQSSTHSDGNILDLVFSHLCTPGNLTNTPFPLSDHNLITFTVSSSSTACLSNQQTITCKTLHHFYSLFSNC